MKNTIPFFGWFCLCFMMPGLALGGQSSLLHVELSYSGSAVAYNLYKDGVQVCVSHDPGSFQMDCTVEIDPTPMTFVLTAVDAEGVESPQSAPYVLVPPPLDPGTGNYLPQANFLATATSGPAPLPVSFDGGGSSDLDGLIIAYAWDFGDGGTGAGKLIDYTFTAAGTYTVTLTVVDDRGASAEKTSTITVGAQPQAANIPPLAVITATSLQTGTSRVAFDAYQSADADGTITSYLWNFGDGDSAAGNSVEHEFKAAGEYTVLLTVVDNKGASTQDQMIMTVVDGPQAANLLPVAAISASSRKSLVHFAWDYTGVDAALAGFRLYQNSRLVCEVANPLAREVDCLTYVDSGEVRLWVTSYDLAGTESAPSPALRFDSTGLSPVEGGEAPLVVHFTSGASLDPDGTIASYVWNFGDGTTGEGMAVDHVFAVPGAYTVTMTVTDNSGGQAQATVVITVADINPPLAADASFTTAQEKPVTGTLTAYDPEGSPLTFKLVGNGSLGTATITNPSTGIFTYVPKTGTFGVDTFTFMADDGSFDSNAAVVSVHIEQSLPAPPAGSIASIMVPGRDPDGSYVVQWTASVTEGAIYVVEEATDSSFTTDLRPVYRGTDLRVSVSGRPNGSVYFYRVRATSAAHSDSVWTVGGNGCSVISTCPGDIDLDFDVDSADLALLSKEFGRTACAEDCFGDLNGDSAVNADDMGAFLRDFGAGSCPAPH